MLFLKILSNMDVKHRFFFISNTDAKKESKIANCWQLQSFAIWQYHEKIREVKTILYSDLVTSHKTLQNMLLLLLFFRDTVALCCPGWSAVMQSVLTAAWDRVAGTTGTCHHSCLVFVFWVETGFYHVGQAGLELLTLSDSPALFSPSAGITSMSHDAHPFYVLLIQYDKGRVK